jgi:DNA-binding transcriptional LysR family regulator
MRNQRYDVPPLDPLLAFEAAARNLSFTKAAAELHLTQSAVSRQIQQLEDHLGSKLFERRARTLLLTENGQLFYRVTQDALEKLHDSARRLRGSTAPNTVVVATTPGFASLWLIPHLAGFTSGHPHVDVRISATNEMIDDLERAQVDVAVRYVPEGSVTGGRLLFGETVFPVCSPALAADASNPLATPDDLHHHVLLYLEHPSCTSATTIS